MAGQGVDAAVTGPPPFARPSLVRRLALRHRRVVAVVRDTVAGTWNDGFTHAGNLAYLSLVTLFPFFILVASVAGALGRTEDGLRAVNAFLRTLPNDVALLVAKPITDVITERSSSGVVTFGVIVALWTISNFMETLRQIIREAYRSPNHLPVWRYRLLSVAVVFASVLAMLVALASQVMLNGAEALVARLMPFAGDVFGTLGLSRALPAGVLFLSLWAVFYVLTPRRFRVTRCPIWPGALVTTLTWVGTSMILPATIALFGGYALTYGSLAGVIVALLFFYIIGLGLVFGANLNAALAKARAKRLKAVERYAMEL